VKEPGTRTTGKDVSGEAGISEKRGLVADDDLNGGSIVRTCFF